MAMPIMIAVVMRSAPRSVLLLPHSRAQRHARQADADAEAVPTSIRLIYLWIGITENSNWLINFGRRRPVSPIESRVLRINHIGLFFFSCWMFSVISPHMGHDVDVQFIERAQCFISNIVHTTWMKSKVLFQLFLARPREFMALIRGKDIRCDQAEDETIWSIFRKMKWNKIK